MSRVGKQPVPIASGATVKVSGREVSVTGGSNTLTFTHRPEVSVEVQDKEVVVTRKNDSKTAKAMHGLTRALIANMIEGVTKGYSKELEITGVGWNARLAGNKIQLNVGYADTREVMIPGGITCEVNGPRIKISGADKQLVGQTAAAIRAQRKPEPYNAKGIKYIDEVLIRKQGKAFAGGG